MLPNRLQRMSVGAAAGIAALTSLIFSLFVARAPHPPGFFLKYVDAATAGRLEPARLLDFSPLYLFLARLLVPLGGKELLLLVQCLFHAATSAFIAASVGALTGPAWALAAGLFAATYRPFLVYAGVLEPENLIVLCLAAAITFGILARRGLRSSQGQEGSVTPWFWAAASGICVGLAAISRPQYVLLTVVWAIWIGIA